MIKQNKNDRNRDQQARGEYKQNKFSQGEQGYVTKIIIKLEWVIVQQTRDVGSMLGNVGPASRRWANVNPELGQRLVFAGWLQEWRSRTHIRPA